MEEDVGVSRRADADAGARWSLHGSLERERAGVEERGEGGRQREVERPTGAKGI